MTDKKVEVGEKYNFENWLLEAALCSFHWCVNNNKIEPFIQILSES